MKEHGSGEIRVLFIRMFRLSGVGASITIVHIQKFYRIYKDIIRIKFFVRISKLSILFLSFAWSFGFGVPVCNPHSIMGNGLRRGSRREDTGQDLRTLQNSYHVTLVF